MRIQDAQDNLGDHDRCVSLQGTICVVQKQLPCVASSAELATCNRKVDARRTRQLDEHAIKMVSALLGIGDHLSEGGEVRKANSARAALPEGSGRPMIIRTTGR